MRGVLPQVGQPRVREGDVHQTERPLEPAGAARGEREVGGGVHAAQVRPRAQGQGVPAVRQVPGAARPVRRGAAGVQEGGAPGAVHLHARAALPQRRRREPLQRCRVLLLVAGAGVHGPDDLGGPRGRHRPGAVAGGRQRAGPHADAALQGAARARAGLLRLPLHLHLRRGALPLQPALHAPQHRPLPALQVQRAPGGEPPHAPRGVAGLRAQHPRQARRGARGVQDGALRLQQAAGAEDAARLARRHRPRLRHDPRQALLRQGGPAAGVLPLRHAEPAGERARGRVHQLRRGVPAVLRHLRAPPAGGVCAGPRHHRPGGDAAAGPAAAAGAEAARGGAGGGAPAGPRRRLPREAPQRRRADAPVRRGRGGGAHRRQRAVRGPQHGRPLPAADGRPARPHPRHPPDPAESRPLRSAGAHVPDARPPQPVLPHHGPGPADGAGRRGQLLRAGRVRGGVPGPRLQPLHARAPGDSEEARGGGPPRPPLQLPDEPHRHQGARAGGVVLLAPLMPKA
mmetsp:Transcript_9304/g.19180  ORF Transcript_9304/g.19180 Transcript_9304/m.19180 type:complete len:513 (+) Transcript_9304:2459-3997(+)